MKDEKISKGATTVHQARNSGAFDLCQNDGYKTILFGNVRYSLASYSIFSFLIIFQGQTECLKRYKQSCLNKVPE